MNKRTEILKKAALFSKRKKLPKRFIVAELTVLLLLMYFAGMIKKIIHKIIRIIFPNTKTVIAYVTIGIILGVFVLPYRKLKPENDRAYGDVAQSNITQSLEMIKQGGVPGVANQAAGLHKFPYTYVEQTYQSVQNIDTDVIQSEQQDAVVQAAEYTDEQLKSMHFLIRVNRLKNCITIYTTDENGEYSIPVKAMLCSTGGENTPLGTYNIRERYLFRKLLFDVYGQYATRIVDQILFHSVSYDSNSKDTLIAEEFNKLGESASHGCIRLTTEDAKWIYDYCKWGTVVEIYEDEYAGPLGKPEVITLPEDTVWDPTDEDEHNPWNEVSPVIEAEDRNIHIGEKFNPLENVTAKDTCGNDITDKIMITEQVNAFVAGEYEVTYSVTDLLGRTAKKSITITVV